MMEAIKAYVGVDWASAKHQVCVLDAEGQLLGKRAFPHGGQGLAAMAAWISATAAVESDFAARAVVRVGTMRQGSMRLLPFR